MTTEQIYSVREMTEMLKIHRVTLLRYLKQGHFPGAFRLGLGARADWRIPESAVKKYKQRTQVMAWEARQD